MTYRLNGEKGKSMNVTREEKMAEAIERMKALRVFKPTIKQFKDDGYISISEPPFGAFYWAEGDDLKRIREFEEQNNALVYLVVRSYTTFGKMDCYCGEVLMLCDECQHSEQRQPCDFDMSTGMCRHRQRPEGATHDVP